MSSDDKATNRINRAGFTFFIADLELAGTLTRIAAEAGADSKKKARNRENARHAYDTVVRLSAQAILTDDERDELDVKLTEVKAALKRLGETF